MPAVEGDGSRRQGAWVIELTDLADLGTWPRQRPPHLPAGTTPPRRPAVAVRHQRGLPPHLLPHRLRRRAAALELRQRRHARVEDRIRCAKACGLRNFPFEDFVRNQAWLAMVMVAQDLLAWTARLCLTGGLARAEPATLRYQLLHVAARIARRGRDLHLRIDATWPWRNQLDAAFARLRTALC